MLYLEKLEHHAGAIAHTSRTWQPDKLSNPSMPGLARKCSVVATCAQLTPYRSTTANCAYQTSVSGPGYTRSKLDSVHKPYTEANVPMSSTTSVEDSSWLRSVGARKVPDSLKVDRSSDKFYQLEAICCTSQKYYWSLRKPSTPTWFTYLHWKPGFRQSLSWSNKQEKQKLILFCTRSC